MIKPEIPHRNCAECTHIEHCPTPFTDLQGHAKTPKNCPRPDEIKLTPRVRDVLPKEYFEHGNT